MSRLQLTLACLNCDRVRALADGRVTAMLWICGMLQDEYDVQPEACEYWTGGEEQPADAMQSHSNCRLDSSCTKSVPGKHFRRCSPPVRSIRGTARACRPPCIRGLTRSGAC